jgi:hypothetical protein
VRRIESSEHWTKENDLPGKLNGSDEHRRLIFLGLGKCLRNAQLHVSAVFMRGNRICKIAFERFVRAEGSLKTSPFANSGKERGG